MRQHLKKPRYGTYRSKARGLNVRRWKRIARRGLTAQSRMKREADTLQSVGSSLITNILFCCAFMHEKLACDKAVERAEQAEQWTETVQFQLEQHYASFACVK